MMNIVLHEPEMPANTGNIGRTCVATGSRLHLIGPLGFQINDKMLKRAGLDYWPDLDVTVYDDFDDFMEKNPGARLYMATTKAKNVYTHVHMMRMHILCSEKRVPEFQSQFFRSTLRLQFVFL